MRAVNSFSPGSSSIWQLLQRFVVDIEVQVGDVLESGLGETVSTGLAKEHKPALCKGRFLRDDPQLRREWPPS